MAMIALMIFGFSGHAIAEGMGYQLFCYLMDVSDRSLSVFTDDEQEYTFELDSQLRVQSHSGRLNLDDVALLSYSGGLNEDTVDQPGVVVRMVTVLSTLNGTIENKDGDILSIREMSDEGAVGNLYLFDMEASDMWTGEAGANVHDEVEVAYEGTKDQLVPDQLQNLSYAHITVYTQMEAGLDDIVSDDEALE